MTGNNWIIEPGIETETVDSTRPSMSAELEQFLAENALSEPYDSEDEVVESKSKSVVLSQVQRRRDLNDRIIARVRAEQKQKAEAVRLNDMGPPVDLSDLAERLSVRCMSGDDFEDKFELKGRLGRGAFGVVLLYLDKSSNENVAVKSIEITQHIKNHDSLERATEEVNSLVGSTKREIEALSKLKGCPNIISLLDVFVQDEDSIRICTEACSVSLYSIMRTQSLSLSQVQAIAVGAVLGLEAIHQHDFIHFDIKPDNILLHKSGTVKLCDFGMAVHVDEKMKIGSTIRYDSPESCYITDTAGAPVGLECYTFQRFFDNVEEAKKTDVWALGITLLELYTAVMPSISATEDPGVNVIRHRLVEKALSEELIRFLTVFYSEDEETRAELKEDYGRHDSLYIYMIHYILRKQSPAIQRKSSTKIVSHLYESTMKTLNRKLSSETNTQLVDSFKEILKLSLQFKRENRATASKLLKLDFINSVLTREKNMRLSKFAYVRLISKNLQHRNIITTKLVEAYFRKVNSSVC